MPSEKLQRWGCLSRLGATNYWELPICPTGNIPLPPPDTVIQLYIELDLQAFCTLLWGHSEPTEKNQLFFEGNMTANAVQRWFVQLDQLWKPNLSTFASFTYIFTFERNIWQPWNIKLRSSLWRANASVSNPSSWLTWIQQSHEPLAWPVTKMKTLLAKAKITT